MTTVLTRSSWSPQPLPDEPGGHRYFEQGYPLLSLTW